MKTIALPPDLADARPKRLRFKLFTLPGQILSHARRLFLRLADVLADAVQLLDARRALRLAFASP